MSDEALVLAERRGALGLITLNRPRAINALSHEMLVLVHGALDAFAEDAAVRTVAITGAGERGLSAGGDVASLARRRLAGERADGAAYFWDEYRVNAAIARYAKPYVAIQDGIVLGGGVGVSAHGSYRLVTERSRVGMPETGIGILPDVGGTWLLSRAPGELGVHLALTGQHFGAADAIGVGFADRYLDSARIPELLRALETDEADAVVTALSSDGAELPAGPVLAGRDWIDRAYAADDVAGILRELDALAAAGVVAAGEAAATLRQKSPTSLVVTLAAVRGARRLASLEDALRVEYRVILRLIEGHDFAEGVRAQLIDKDRNPQWRPAELDDVDPELVASLFAPLPGAELDFSSDAAAPASAATSTTSTATTATVTTKE